MERDGAVVVVDDEDEILDIIGEVLEEDGYQVLRIEHPRRVMEMDDSADASLYLLDLMMPEMDGIQLARQLRRKHEQVPMIAMSASSGMLHRARDSGLFNDFLAKPFDLVDLLDRVEWYAR